MKRTNFILFLMFVLILLSSTSVSADNVEAVYLLPIEGPIEPGLAEFVARVLRDAESANAAVLLEINTFGGRVDAATEIRDLIVRMNVPVISFVRDRAWSAGALITLAAPYVAMAPGSSIGAAEPRPLEEKTVSALRAEFESTAERSGRDPLIAAAMVDADVEIEGLVEAEKILTLSANSAAERGFADIVVSSREAVLEHFDLDKVSVIEFTPNWAEKLARFITEPTISSLLLTLAFLGLVFEVSSLGWGVPGSVGLVALALFFGGRYVVGLAGLEVILLFIVGSALILAEVLVFPGFGLAGGFGVISVFASIFLSFGDALTALYVIMFSFMATLFFVIIFWNKFTRSKVWERLILSTIEHKDLGYKGPKTYNDLVGKQGHTITPLRPSGTVIIDGERFDVVSEGGFLASNTTVKVVKIEGSRVVVGKVD